MKLTIPQRVAVSAMNLISETWRINIEGEFPQKPAVIAFWHGKMLPAWKIFSKSSPVGVVSQSRDGEILSLLLLKWGFRLIRGSSSKDSKTTLAEIINSAQKDFVLITPDGPRGPQYRFKAGALIAAQRSGCKLVLCAVMIKRKIVFRKSWDRFEFPIPFTKISIAFSEPMTIDPNLTKDETSEKIFLAESMLNQINGTYPELMT